jgi:hypothetical protein
MPTSTARRGFGQKARRYLFDGLAAIMLWLMASVASEALGGLATSSPSLSASATSGWLDGVDTWFQSGGGAGMAIALLASSVVTLFRRRPMVVHQILQCVGVVGLFVAAYWAHPIVAGHEDLARARDVTAFILLFAIAIGSATAFVNSYEKNKSTK